MALNTKAIKRRIKSIGNTKKITKAMEMISAVKMRRAVANALATRSYAKLAWDIINDIAKKTRINSHPLLTQRPVEKIGIIIITSNRGLAGGFTSRLFQAAQQYIKDVSIEAEPQIDVILTGKHGRKSIHKLRRTVVAEFEKQDMVGGSVDITSLAAMVTKGAASSASPSATSCRRTSPSVCCRRRGAPARCGPPRSCERPARDCGRRPAAPSGAPRTVPSLEAAGPVRQGRRNGPG